MKTTSIARAIGAISLLPLFAACGGGDSGADAPSGNGPSADQQAHASMAVAPAGGLFQLRWSITTSPSLAGYVVSDRTLLAASPEAGAQKSTITAPVNLTQTLAVPNFAPTRVLKDGRILVVPTSQQSTVTTFFGTDVQVDTLANDGTTVAISQRRSGFTVVPLTGTMANAPTEYARWHSVFWENPTYFVPSTPFLAGAAYVKYTARAHGDRHVVNDCVNPVTTGAIPTPCLTGSTLQAAFATGQLAVPASGGTFSTVGGVPVWISTNALPVTGTPMHRLYFQLNGNVYMGHVIRDNAVIYGNRWFQPGTGVIDLPFQIRLNQAAHDSMANALAL